MRMIDRQIEQFLTNCQIKQLSKKTMKAYSQALLLMADYLQGQYKITDAEQVRAINISDYIGYLQERGKYIDKSAISYSRENEIDLTEVQFQNFSEMEWQGKMKIKL